MERLKITVAGVAATLGSLGVGEVVRAEQPVEIEAQTPDMQNGTASEFADDLSPESKVAFYIIMFGAPAAIGAAYWHDWAKRKRDKILS